MKKYKNVMFILFSNDPNDHSTNWNDRRNQKL